MQDGTLIINTFNWQRYLIPKFKEVQQINSYYNFRFSNGMPFYKKKLSKKSFNTYAIHQYMVGHRQEKGKHP